MEKPLVIRACQKKIATIVILCAAVTMLAALKIPLRPTVGWVGVVLFGGATLALLIFARPSANYIKLDRHGFKIARMGRSFTTPWSQVEGFYVGEVVGNKMIGITYKPGYQDRKPLRSLSRALSGMEEGVGDHYVMALEEICETLNRWKQANT